MAFKGKQYRSDPSHFVGDIRQESGPTLPATVFVFTS